MKLSAIVESVTFSVAKVNPEKNWVETLATKKQKDCEACDGAGKNEWDGKQYDCEYCKGTGKYEDWVSDYPELNVSNANAYAFLNALGISTEELGGTIEPKDFPEIRRKLMRLINTSDADSYQRDSEVYGGDTKIDRSGNVPEIKRTAKIYSMGLSSDRIKTYARTLLNMIDIAAKEGFVISFA